MAPPTFGANSAAARDIATVLHPYTDLQAHQEIGPVVITRGKGVRVWDDAGKEYIESVAGLWCAALGFDNERLVQAAVAQMRKLPFYHAFTAKSHEPMIDLAEMLLERAPVPMSKVFFANSGSEANDSAIKMVWYFNNALGRTQKKKIIGRLKGYHGITIGSASLTGLPVNHRSFDVPLPGFVHTMTPHHYHGALPGESEDDFASRCAEELDKLIVAEGPDTVAAMWAEPIMGAGGVIVPPRGYFPKIQAVLKKHDVLLVADEVICGFWRTGNYWGCQTLDIQPDILSLRQGAVVVVSADQCGDGESARVRRAVQREPRDRHVWPRLYLFRSSGAGGGGDRDAEDLRRTGHRHACPRSRRVYAARTTAAVRRPRAGGRSARRRPDRGDGTGGRQGRA